MIIKVFGFKYIDLTKVVAINLTSAYYDNILDSIEFNIQLLEKPLYVEHPEANLIKSTSSDIISSTQKEFERILELWKNLNTEPLQKYIPVKDRKDEQSLTEFLNKGWTVKFVNKVQSECEDDISREKQVYNEYIISNESSKKL